MVIRILCYALLGIVLGACDSTISDSLKKANEVKIMSQLKKYYSGQIIHSIERQGRMVSFKELYENKSFGDFIDEEFYQAWNGHSDPKPQNGYLYSEIETESGNDINRNIKAGLIAYPKSPGMTSGDVIAILIDMDKNVSAMDGDYSSEEELIAAMQQEEQGGNEWNFYTASSDVIQGPVTDWPSESELKSKWNKLKKHRAGDGIDVGKIMMDQYGKLR